MINLDQAGKLGLRRALCNHLRHYLLLIALAFRASRKLTVFVTSPTPSTASKSSNDLSTPSHIHTYPGC